MIILHDDFDAAVPGVAEFLAQFGADEVFIKFRHGKRGGAGLEREDVIVAEVIRHLRNVCPR